MKYGLIIGKFMPLTKGHMALIEFGKRNCDILVVAVCYTKGEPISGIQRFGWVNDTYKNDKKVFVTYVEEDLPDAPYSDREVSKVWAEYLKERFPLTSIIFGSEQYVNYVAEYMGIEGMIFDEARNEVPISATMIRENPYKCWDMIPSRIKPYFLKKICIYGSESCGKSTLTKRLAEHYKTSYVPEMARYIGEFCNVDWDNCTEEMFLAFAKSQSETIQTMSMIANGILFVDSDNFTTQIYANSYIGMSSERIKCYDTIEYDAYILMKPDCPFVQDGTRKYEQERWQMHERFKNKLIENNVKFYEVGGDWEERFEEAKKIVDKLILK
jgi:HTH-type transcriptional repressor of NAD biosynthesis genes